jgi:hypothetical protein
MTDGGVMHQLGRSQLAGRLPSLVHNSESGIRAGVRENGVVVSVDLVPALVGVAVLPHPIPLPLGEGRAGRLVKGCGYLAATLLTVL